MLMFDAIVYCLGNEAMHMYPGPQFLYSISFISAYVALKYSGAVQVIFLFVPFCQFSPPFGEVIRKEELETMAVIVTVTLDWADKPEESRTMNFTVYVPAVE